MSGTAGLPNLHFYKDFNQPSTFLWFSPQVRMSYVCIWKLDTAVEREKNTRFVGLILQRS